MPDDGSGPAGKVEGIPLFLIPKAVAEQIKKNGDAIFQIHVERKFHHRYTVRVETLDEHARRLKQGDFLQDGDSNG
ncbi:hypothetical protein [Methanoregula sp.]|uniref:hypothetical protein n=1 Tax=Methanoregula sp. TaxID=2052170 RepID=UPI00356150F8